MNYFMKQAASDTTLHRVLAVCQKRFPSTTRPDANRETAYFRWELQAESTRLAHVSKVSESACRIGSGGSGRSMTPRFRQASFMHQRSSLVSVKARFLLR